jgi:hypothetical protein
MSDSEKVEGNSSKAVAGRPKLPRPGRSFGHQIKLVIILPMALEGRKVTA